MLRIYLSLMATNEANQVLGTRNFLSEKNCQNQKEVRENLFPVVDTLRSFRLVTAQRCDTSVPLFCDAESVFPQRTRLGQHKSDNAVQLPLSVT